MIESAESKSKRVATMQIDRWPDKEEIGRRWVGNGESKKVL